MRFPIYGSRWTTLLSNMVRYISAAGELTCGFHKPLKSLVNYEESEFTGVWASATTCCSPWTTRKRSHHRRRAHRQRSGTWIKYRLNLGQEFVIGGYTLGPHGASKLTRLFASMDQLDACLSNLLDLPVTFVRMLAILAACPTANDTTWRWSGPSALSISGSSLVLTAHSSCLPTLNRGPH